MPRKSRFPSKAQLARQRAAINTALTQTSVEQPSESGQPLVIPPPTGNAAADTATIQTVLNDGAGGAVMIPNFEYLVSSKLLVPANTYVFGFGRGSRLKSAPGMNTDVIGTSVGQDRIKLENFTVDGNKANQTNVSGGGVMFANPTNITIQNVRVFNTYGRGVYLFNPSDFLVDGCVIENTGGGADRTINSNQGGVVLFTPQRGRAVNNWITGTADAGITTPGSNARDLLVANNIVRSASYVGIVTGSGGTRINVEGNIVLDCIANGIDTGSCSWTAITGNTVYNCNGGIIVDFAAVANAGYVTIDGNTVDLTTDVETFSGQGIGINANAPNLCEAIHVTDNVVRDSARGGITMNQVIGGSIADNTVKNSSRVRPGQAGIDLFGACSGISIHDNRSYDDRATKLQTHGIRSADTCDFLRVHDNDVRGNLTGPISLVGTNNKVDGNITGESTAVASAATITLPIEGSYFTISGTTGITSIAASRRDRIVTLKFDSTLTVTDGSNLILAGNFPAGAGSQLTLVYDGTNWREIARSANG